MQQEAECLVDRCRLRDELQSAAQGLFAQVVAFLGPVQVGEVDVGLHPTGRQPQCLLVCLLRRGDLTEMKPGMTFHFMPALWQDDWGLEITESVLVTETGYELLADVPRKLFVKD